MLRGAQQQVQCLALSTDSAVGALVGSEVGLRRYVLAANGIGRDELV